MENGEDSLVNNTCLRRHFNNLCFAEHHSHTRIVQQVTVCRNKTNQPTRKSTPSPGAPSNIPKRQLSRVHF